ncbi:YusW family protein [Ureibacillus composti]|nr:YusW family protein [Ureibacillus composti]
MKKYLKGIFSVPLLIGLLYGCNANEGDQVTIDNKENEQTDGTEDDKGIDTQTEGQTQKDESNRATDENAGANVDTTYNFTHFDLDVEYANDKSYDVEFANDQKGMSAEYDDEINGEHLTGDDAMNKIEKYLELLTFDANSDPEEIRSQIISAFELDENYTEFDLEVRFTNGEVKEYNFKG